MRFAYLISDGNDPALLTLSEVIHPVGRVSQGCLILKCCHHLHAVSTSPARRLMMHTRPGGLYAMVHS